MGNIVKEIKKFVDGLRKNKKNKKLYQTGWIGGGSELPVDSSTIVQTNFLWSADGTNGNMVPNPPNSKVENDKRIDKKPVEVFQEIISEEPKMNLQDLDKQIDMVTRRKEILQSHIGQNSFPDETQALTFLNSRKKYLKFKHLLKWQVTNDSKITELCKKYKVMKVGFSGYYKNVPMEAIDEIEKFSNVHAKITDVMPMFWLIVDDGGKETRKDPILLAQSPFGKWYYVLGAWDKEVEIVDDLIYKGK